MAADPLTQINTRTTPQSEKAAPEQVRNSAGGYVFAAADVDRIRRFLILGTTGGSFYANQREATLENTDLVLDWARHRTEMLVDEVVAISTAGRALRQQPALFALAAAAGLGDVRGRAYALDHLETVCRTATMLFQFVTYVEQFRGWGPSLRRAVGRWYVGRPLDDEEIELTDVEDGVGTRPVADLAYQVTKYRTRHGWTHSDLLRLSHGGQSTRNGSKNVSPGVELEPDRAALFDWVSGRKDRASACVAEHDSLRVVEGFEKVQAATDEKRAAELVGEYKLAWEHVPDRFVNSPIVLEAMLETGMPINALVRQLPRLTRAGLLAPLGGSWTRRVAEMLTDSDRLRSGRVHPMKMLIASHVYAAGVGERGLTWTPSRPIVDALSDGFYAAFGALKPSGRRILYALDVSGSMRGPVNGVPHLMCSTAAAAFALASASIETDYDVVAFSSGKGERGRVYNRPARSRFGRGDGISPLPISPRQRIDDVVSTMSEVPMGGTDCALPMLYALDEGLQVDAFVLFTDSETWAGEIHAHQALRRYREQTGINAKFIVAAMRANRYSVADPADPNSMDIVGLDGDVPTLISNFIR